jgi:hypothetical protein
VTGGTVQVSDKLSLQQFVEILDSEPSEQCVVAEHVYENFDFSPEIAARRAGRQFNYAIEFTQIKSRPGVSLRCKVMVFSPKENE